MKSIGWVQLKFPCAFDSTFIVKHYNMPKLVLKTNKGNFSNSRKHNLAYSPSPVLSFHPYTTM